MEKIKLKAWHKILIFSVLGVLILLVVISFLRNKPATEEKHLPVASTFRIDIFPADSCYSMFDDEIIKGDSMSFETIEGNTGGWIFRVFCVGQRLDYVFSFDVRDTDHVWKKGDVVILDSDSMSNDKRKVNGSVLIELMSNYQTGYNTYLTDQLDFPEYSIEIKCTRYDSLAAFTGKLRTKKKEVDGPGSKNTLMVNGNFRADVVKIGKRVVN